MPSTTSNYGWTYPISSDDLNAGATSIGSLATGADASLKAEANTRYAADDAKCQAGGVAVNMRMGTTSKTTDSGGNFVFAEFNASTGIVWCTSRSGTIVVANSGGGWTAYDVIVSNYGAINALTPVANTSLTLNIIRWIS